MKIGIIGAGQIGGTLTRRLAALGHEVFVANSRGPESLARLAKETGAKAVSAPEAARSGSVVVVTIPQAKIRDLPKDLFAGVPRDVVVVDTGNYYPRERDGRIEEIENGMTESQWVQQHLGRPVVKAFNNIYAQHLMDFGRPAGSPGRYALPVAGDDEWAKGVVIQLLNELGIRWRGCRHPRGVLAPAARLPGLRRGSRRRRRTRRPGQGCQRAPAAVAGHAPQPRHLCQTELTGDCRAIISPANRAAAE